MIQIENCVKKFKDLILTELNDKEINCWIAGGSVRDYFMGIPIKTDIDLFFPNQEEYNKASNFFKEKNSEIKWESNNGMKVMYKNKTFDLVKLFFENPKDTINNFDFTVSMLAVDKSNVYFGETTVIDLAKRQLMINKIKYPASTTSRMVRYLKKGFKICNGELYKIIKSIQEEERKKINENNNSNSESNNIEEIKNDEEISSGDLFSFFIGID